MLKPLEILKKIATNRYGQLAIAALAGATIMYFFMPEKEIIKKETTVEYKDRIITQEVIKYVDREVVKEVKVIEKVKSVKRKETFPDGHIIEEEIYESESEQVARVAEQEKERYAASLALKEQEFAKKEEYLKEHINAKHFSLAGGVGTQVDAFQNKYFYGQFTYDMWGPFQITGQATSEKQIGLGIGVKF